MKKRRKKPNHFGGWVRRAVQDTIEDRDSHESDASDLAEIIVICVLQNLTESLAAPKRQSPAQKEV